jgi:Tol biopolymer transport system component
MVRPTLEADAPFACVAGRTVGLPSLQFRRTNGGPSEDLTLPVTNADVLQLERQGNNIILSAARFGEPFTPTQLTDLPLGHDVYVGLYVSSHFETLTERAFFRNVRIIHPIKEGFVPYRDYIGSVLEILDVDSGLSETVYSSEQPFEAPNWTPDGKAVIYNISGRATGWGRLARFDLATKTPTLINTDPANLNNNDHVLSFDGTTLAISDQSRSHGGQSAVFTVPVEGGTAQPITKLSPSYAHGWSPDGKFIVYTGGRSNKYDIYKTAADGTGPEIRLTDAPGLNDGPEYTPDGKYIYFNSSRSGRMQLWRMKPDGNEQEQITNDEFNNWFPHVSPDGKWIAFISFSGDVSPTDHPYYKQVYLRLLPIEGGKPKVIAYVYGGQGTMNVPSWSPDSQRLAFVSNSR